MPTIEQTRGDVGQGVYAVEDFRRLLAISDSGQRPVESDRAPAARHARRARWGDAGHWLRTALNPVQHAPWRADYSFSDLISLLVVRELLLKGVALHKIKEAEAWLREVEGTDRPFVREDIKTDGVEVFYRDELIATQIEAASRRGQQTMRELIKDRLTSVKYQGGIAAYWRPAPGVVVDPRVQFGEPVVIGTRIPTDAVAGVVKRLGRDRAMRRFDLSAEQIEDAVAFEDRMAAVN
jgi:uncharacterized protein (DUF433 family)